MKCVQCGKKGAKLLVKHNKKKTYFHYDCLPYYTQHIENDIKRVDENAKQ